MLAKEQLRQIKRKAEAIRSYNEDPNEGPNKDKSWREAFNDLVPDITDREAIYLLASYILRLYNHIEEIKNARPI